MSHFNQLKEYLEHLKELQNTNNPSSHLLGLLNNAIEDIEQVLNNTQPIYNEC